MYEADGNGSMTGTYSTSTLDVGDADATSTDARAAATVDDSRGDAPIAYITRGDDKNGTRISVATGNTSSYSGSSIMGITSSMGSVRWNGMGTNQDGTPNYTGRYIRQ